MVIRVFSHFKSILVILGHSKSSKVILSHSKSFSVRKSRTRLIGVGLVFLLSGGIHRDIFYPNFESSYLMNGLTDWLDFLYGNIIWPCLLMCEVSRNLSKYNHPNQPTYPKISKQRSYENILRHFLKFCMNNHATIGQILGKLDGDRVITFAIIT